MQLTPLRDDDLADYLSRRFSETGRKVDEALDLLLDFAAGHPQRAMLIAHYLWEHTDPGETADETSFAAAIEAVHDEVADQLASLWGGFDDSERRAIAAVAANPAGPCARRPSSRSVSPGPRAATRWPASSAPATFSPTARWSRFTDPLLGRWVANGRQGLI